jgi:hypothetical protein
MGKPENCAMKKRPRRPHPTPIQDIALSLIFAAMGESRFNRTYDQYMAIAKRLPPLKVLTAEVNQLLEQAHRSNNECNGFVLPQLYRFKGGDERVIFEPYPQHISYETVREALESAAQACPRSAKLPQMSIRSKAGSKTTFDY